MKEEKQLMETVDIIRIPKATTTKWILAMGLTMAAVTGWAADAAGGRPWPGIKGVVSTFTPSGNNYGNIGSLVIKNNTDKPVTVTVPAGMLLDSSDPAIQDLYIAPVPTETTCQGARYIGQGVTVKAGETFVMKDLSGFCPDHEKDPPKKDDTAVYACRQPDEKSKELLRTIGLMKTIDVGSLKLEVFEEAKATTMMTQGALWMVDSRIDEVKDNEVSGKDLSDKFYGAFATSAKKAFDKMTPDSRKQAETLVMNDIIKIVAATSFIAKQQVPDKKDFRN